MSTFISTNTYFKYLAILALERDRERDDRDVCGEQERDFPVQLIP